MTMTMTTTEKAMELRDSAKYLAEVKKMRDKAATDIDVAVGRRNKHLATLVFEDLSAAYRQALVAHQELLESC